MRKLVTKSILIPIPETATDQNTQQQPTDYEVADTEVAQLKRRVRGARETWVVHVGRGKLRRKVTLGDCATLPILRARSLARDLLDAGPDPKDAAVSEKISVAEFGELFLTDCAGQWKASTLKTNRQIIATSIASTLGDRRLTTLTRADVTAWMQSSDLKKGGQNRALTVLSGICHYAELRGLREPGSNPCKGLRRHRSNFAALYLDDAGFAALGRAFNKTAAHDPEIVTFLRFLALTGCRKSEALGLTWAMIDGARAVLPDATHGPKTIWLGEPARKLLSTIPRTHTHVFIRNGAPITVRPLYRVWSIIRADMKMPKLRIHDLRHSFASVAVRQGYNLIMVGGLLGHSDKGSTEGYAHLATQDIAAASNRVGQHFKTVIAGKPKPAKRKRKPRPQNADKIFTAFIRSKDTLTDFCQQQNLNPATFRKDLTAWRALERRVSK